MRKILATAAVLVLTSMTLTGCGGDDDTPSGSSAYCDDLQAAKDSFSGLLNNEIGQDTFVELRDSLTTLVADAPSRLKDEDARSHTGRRIGTQVTTWVWARVPECGRR